jgi:NCAIR mutase (PurE)-related protein
LISESVKSNTVSTYQALSTAVQSETILHLSEVVCATLKNQEFIDSIIPLISEKVMLLIKPKIAKIVDECMQPHLEPIQHNTDALILQEIQNTEQKDQISSMKSKINNLEKRLEEQEQYSRRTSLRFNNVKVPTNSNNVVQTPIDTDSLVLDIC